MVTNDSHTHIHTHFLSSGEARRPTSVVAVPPKEMAWVDLTAVTSVAAAAGPRLPMETAAPKAKVDAPPPVLEVAAVADVVEGGASVYVEQPAPHPASRALPSL